MSDTQIADRLRPYALTHHRMRWHMDIAGDREGRPYGSRPITPHDGRPRKTITESRRFLEWDPPDFGFRLAPETVWRFWTMLVHTQSAQLNASALAASLGVVGNTVRHYLDVLSDMFMVRLLEPWSGKSRKRLVKSPKVYIRDSGLLHRLAGISDLEANLALCPDTWRASYYRTSARVEIDLVLEGPKREVHAVEIKRGLAPVPSKGFILGCEDVTATHRRYIMPSGERHPIGMDIDALSLRDAIAHFETLWR